MRPSGLCFLGAFCALLGGCQEPGEREASWDLIHASIIAPNCATSSCHTDFSRTAGVSLEDPDDAYEFLLGEEGFVVPGDAASPIFFLLRGDERALMPPDGPLPKASVDLIRDWVTQGAER